MTKFVKVNRIVDKGKIEPTILNQNHIESIVACSGNLRIYMASGDFMRIDENDWPMLGIDLVQELHSGWEEKSTAEQLGNALQHLERQRRAEMEQDQDQEYKWTEVAVSLGGSATFVDSDLCQGEPASFTLGKFAVETHKFGTQQYVKDES